MRGHAVNSLFHTIVPACDWSFAGCPSPPDWQIAREEIEARYPWLRALADVPHQPEYHAEGDVLTHTHMVGEALTALEEWRTLAPVERSLLFAAALLHDIAKATCTRVEPDGQITSPGHARAGASTARSLLWRAEPPVPFQIREIIARLVRHHGLPLWFWDKADPRRSVIAASQSVRLDWVALLAEADVRGRICADQDSLLDRIALFREYCAEQQCYRVPRAFATDHSRFVYFHSAQPDPDYAAYDDTRCEVILMSGLPGAGKDTWLRDHHPDLPVISLDQIRREMGVAASGDQGTVVQAAKERARVYLRQGRSFAWNATNIVKSIRSQLIDLFASYGARISIVYLDTPFDTIIRRNARRSRPDAVPERVITRMADRLDVPDLTEAHRVEWINDSED
jgi:putative nucleotidyltransferase with HDIG domain